MSKDTKAITAIKKNNQVAINDFFDADQQETHLKYSQLLFLLLECFVHYDADANFSREYKIEMMQRIQNLNGLIGELKPA